MYYQYVDILAVVQSVDSPVFVLEYQCTSDSASYAVNKTTAVAISAVQTCKERIIRDWTTLANYRIICAETQTAHGPY